MKSKKLNANHLKMIAIVAMTIDHIADIIYPSFPANPVAIVMHMIGRLTAPIMWFFIAEGFYKTRSLKKYFFRLLLFAVISHFFQVTGVPLNSAHLLLSVMLLQKLFIQRKIYFIFSFLRVIQINLIKIFGKFFIIPDFCVE